MKWLLALVLAAGLASPALSSDKEWRPTPLERETALTILAEKYIAPYDRSLCDEVAWAHLTRHLDFHESVSPKSECPIFDRYTYLLPPEAALVSTKKAMGSFVGAGIWTKHDEQGLVYVVGVVPKSGAEQAGLLQGDLLVSLAESGGTPVALTAANEDAVIAGNREKGSVFSLVIRRDGVAMTREITRGTLIQPSVSAEIATVNTKGVALPRPVGVLKVSHFSGNTTDQFEDGVEKIQREYGKDTPFIVDFWTNEGGSVEGELEFLYNLSSDLDIPTVSMHERNRVTALTQRDPLPVCFEKDRAVMVTRGDGLRLCTPFSDSGTDFLKIPGRFDKLRLVFLLSRETISAPETVAAAIKASIRGGDAKRITLIGAPRTHGKGVVQMSTPITTETGRSVARIMLTFQEFRAAGDTKIDGVGVEPDIVIPDDPTLSPKDNFNETHKAAYDRAFEELFPELRAMP